MCLVRRDLLGLILYSQSSHLQLSIFQNIISYQIERFLKQWIRIEHWICIQIQWIDPIGE